MAGFGWICASLQLVSFVDQSLYVNIYISLVQCPGGKFRVTFNVKNLKQLKKRISRGGKSHSTSEFETSQFSDEMVQCYSKLCAVSCYCLFVPLQRQQRDKLSPEAVELAQRLLNFRMPGLSEGSFKQTTMHILIARV